MNLAWEVALRAMEESICTESMRFTPNFKSSPYRETAFEEMNLSELQMISTPNQMASSLEKIPIPLNPLYRFSHIFSDLFHPSTTKYPQLRELLFDLLLHYRTRLDLRRGLTRSEYYIRAILKDLLDGVYGDAAAKAILLFEKNHVKMILYGMLHFFRCGCLVSSFSKMIHRIYPSSIGYRSRNDHRELLIYLPVAKSAIEQQKVDFLIGMFLPVNHTVYVFWQHHFGVMDMDETMQLDHVILF